MDLVSHLLNTFHLNASVSVRARFCGQWRLEHPYTGQASFHLVVAGQCWLHQLDGDRSTQLTAGDLLILPRDAPHRLSDAKALSTDRPPEFLALSTVREEDTGIVCGRFEFDHRAPNPLLDALPDYLLIHTRSSETGHLIRQLVDLLVAEAKNEAPGFEAILDRLADTLFIHALREYLSQHRDRQGLAAAVADSRIHRALHLIHEHPEARWTVLQLARHVAMSRSAFVQRFTLLMGEAPMTYVTRWRMHLAYRWLSNREAVATVADYCGYATEAGFSKAFKRVYGVGPGAIRRSSRTPSVVDHVASPEY